VRAQALVAGRVDATSLSVGTWITIQKDPGVRLLVDQNTYYKNATVVEKVDAATTKIRRLFLQLRQPRQNPAHRVSEWADTRFSDDVLKEIGPTGNSTRPPALRNGRVARETYKHDQ